MIHLIWHLREFVFGGDFMESSFQFTTPSLVGLEYEIYEGFSNENNAEININMELSVSVERIKEEDKAKVSLTLILGRKNTEVPFYIKAIETETFSSSGQCTTLMDMDSKRILYADDMYNQIKKDKYFEKTPQLTFLESNIDKNYKIGKSLYKN